MIEEMELAEHYLVVKFNVFLCSWTETYKLGGVRNPKAGTDFLWNFVRSWHKKELSVQTNCLEVRGPSTHSDYRILPSLKCSTHLRVLESAEGIFDCKCKSSAYSQLWTVLENNSLYIEDFPEQQKRKYTHISFDVKWRYDFTFFKTEQISMNLTT